MKKERKEKLMQISDLTDENNQLKNTISRLEREKEDAQMHIIDLTDENNQLKYDVSRLESKNDLTKVDKMDVSLQVSLFNNNNIAMNDIPKFDRQVQVSFFNYNNIDMDDIPKISRQVQVSILNDENSRHMYNDSSTQAWSYDENKNLNHSYSYSSKYDTKNQKPALLPKKTTQPQKRVLDINDMKISEFNSLGLKIKQCISDYLSIQSNSVNYQFFKAISQLIHLFFEINDSFKQLFFEIIYFIDEYIKNNIMNTRIQLLSYSTEILIQSNLLKSQILYDIISKFDEFIFEFKYPSAVWKYHTTSLFNSRKNISIAVLISEINQINTIIQKNKCIKYAKLDGSTIISIDNYAFSGCSYLVKVIIPSSVTSIGNNAFSGCSSLKQITIPSSVTSIGDRAFYDCSSLVQITFEIPSCVVSIGNEAFFNCSSLTQIIIPSSVISIGDNVFSECLSLMQITISSSLYKKKVKKN